MKNLLKIFYIAFFIALCSLPSVCMLFGLSAGEGMSDSVREAPSLFVDGKPDTQFPQKFDDYFSTNFAFRNELVTAEALIEYKVFANSSNDKVIAGRNGWLYFSETLGDYTGESLFSDRTVWRISHTIEMMNEYCEANGVTMVFAAAPNKNTVYPQYMPKNIIKSSEHGNLDRLSELLRGSPFYVDLKQMFSELDDETIYYHKLDSHWNNLGALEVYNAVGMNLSGRIDAYEWNDYRSELSITQTTVSGDLSKMLFPKLDYLDVQYDLGLEKRYTSERPLTDKMAIRIDTTCADGTHSAVIFRDSFANSLIDLFSNNFASASYRRAMPYDLGCVVDEGYDIVICEIAQRNIGQIAEHAPVMYALPARLPNAAIAQSDKKQYCSMVRDENGFSVFGVLSDDVILDTESRIYVSFGDMCVEAFPIADGEPENDRGFYVSVRCEGQGTELYDDMKIYVCGKTDVICCELGIK